MSILRIFVGYERLSANDSWEISLPTPNNGLNFDECGCYVFFDTVLEIEIQFDLKAINRT